MDHHDHHPAEKHHTNAFFEWPIVHFFKSGAASGVVLIASMIAALIWANSPWGHTYHELWETYAGVTIGDFQLKLSLHHWINDALMAIFFFHVGLEIKRELMTGELSSRQKAALPLMGALGGMIVPALLYTLLNFHTDGARGWGIPMATDIAFALGVLVLLGDRVPLGLKVFLTALAIVDDLGAVLVIALFYTAELNIQALGIGLGVIVLLFVANRLGIRRRSFYVAVGVVVWYYFLQSGVHATVAGVLVAMTVPHKVLADRYTFLKTAGESLKALEKVPEDAAQHSIIEQREVALHAIEKAAERWGSPLHRLEHDLTRYVLFIIMPLFALANAGVKIHLDTLGSVLTESVTMGIFIGLVAGKLGGIFFFSWISVRTGMAKLPRKVTNMHILGASALGGIGFTMSLFIANLAFHGTHYLDSSKVGILVGSFLAALIGSGVILLFTKKEVQHPEREILDFSGR